MIYFSGIDVGALSTEAAHEAFDKVLLAAGIRCDDVGSIAATGYGRISVPMASKRVTETSCHALGSHHLFPDTGTVIDIGGQDSKVIRFADCGKVLDFAMHDKCAAGTGRFLEVMASKLRVPLEKMSDLSIHAEAEVRISSVCTVFAESEVVSLVAKNHTQEEIIRGLHRAIVNRIGGMVKAVGIYAEVTMSGGVAKHKGVVQLMEEKLGKPIRVYAEPQIVSALGAALFAWRESRTMNMYLHNPRA